MKSFVPVLALFFAAAQAVDMKSYVQDADVEPEFKGFVEEFYKTTEDKKATDTYADFWKKDGSEAVVFSGEKFPGSVIIISLKQKQLPILGNKSLLHIVNNASIIADTAESKIYSVDYVLQSTAAACSEVNGKAEFTILKGTDGTPGLTPHAGTMRLYNSTINPTKTPTDTPCKKV